MMSSLVARRLFSDQRKTPEISKNTGLNVMAEPRNWALIGPRSQTKKKFNQVLFQCRRRRLTPVRMFHFKISPHSTNLPYKRRTFPQETCCKRDNIIKVNSMKQATQTSKSAISNMFLKTTILSCFFLVSLSTQSSNLKNIYKLC